MSEPAPAPYAPTDTAHAAPGIEIPARLAARQVDGKGAPIPYFVRYFDGKPDFRYVDPQKILTACIKNLCFLCGEPLGRHRAFLIGPTSTLSRVSAEPPMHRDCAEYAVKACPFLTDPDRGRRQTKMPEGIRDPAGTFFARNPSRRAATCWRSR